MKILLALLLSLPLFAQLPAGVTRVAWPDGMGPVREPMRLVIAPNGVLWGANGPYPFTGAVLDGVDLANSTPEKTITLPSGGSATGGLVVADDGAIWIGGATYVARFEPVTFRLERWTHTGGASTITAGPDGNIWITVAFGSVVRLRPDGTVVSMWEAANPGARIYGAAFGSDGAFYVSAEGQLVRLTMTGERTVFATANSGRLYPAGPGFFWVGSKFDHIYGPHWSLPADVVKMSFAGATAGTYRAHMVPRGADALGNLWLRRTEGANEIYGQLNPTGVLTTWSVPGIPWDTGCNARGYGGFALLPDGRVALADYYLAVAWPPGACDWNFPGRDTSITILDPRVAPVLSVEQLNPVRRRSARH